VSGRGAQVVLVSMPFGNIFSPSMGLSLLKGSLNRERIPSRVLYFTMSFARQVGQSFYMGIANGEEPTVRELAGEWIFAQALFGDAATDERTYVEEVLGRRRGWVTGVGVQHLPSRVVNSVLEARTRVDAFLDECVETVLSSEPRVVGFSSVFQQHIASLALAARLRRARPDLVLILGGANCEGVMGSETARQFPFLDAVFSGEADLVFPDLVKRAIAGEPLDGLPGVKTPAIARTELETGGLMPPPSVRSMDDLPYPDFDDFFEQFNRMPWRNTWAPSILFETSRGCWWGEKQHCTFCGLNGLTMSYRSKSPARALSELDALTRRHPGIEIQVVDNILDMRYFQTVLPALARKRRKPALFYETKSNLRKEQVRVLSRAGVVDLQPGIESFSDTALRMMRKGVSGIQNLQLLKWCREFGITVHWNILWGFPGEPPEDYRAFERVMPFLTHLTPPTGVGGIRLDRFSPNFTESASLGFEDVRPLPAYQYVYALPAEAVANLAYHFTFSYREAQNPDDYIKGVLAGRRRWIREHEGSAVFYADTGRELVIGDMRPAATTLLTVLRGVDRLLYREADAAADVKRLAEVAAEADPNAGLDEITRRLDSLVEAGLMYRSGTRYLALAIPLGDYAPPADVANRFWDLAAGLGHRRDGGLEVPVGPNGHPERYMARRPSRYKVKRRSTTRRVQPLLARSFSVDGRDPVLVRIDGGHGARRRRA
jgi:ribosomal peptide maturation radical SAM protein 1